MNSIERGLLDQHPGAGAAVLAGVVEAADGAAAAAARSESANTMLALLPPSSSVTGFTWAAHRP